MPTYFIFQGLVCTFQALVCTFQALVCTFQGLVCIFQGLKYKFPWGMKKISFGNRQDRCRHSVNKTL